MVDARQKIRKSNSKIIDLFMSLEATLMYSNPCFTASMVSFFGIKLLSKYGICGT